MTLLYISKIEYCPARGWLTVVIDALFHGDEACWTDAPRIAIAANLLLFDHF